MPSQVDAMHEFSIGASKFRVPVNMKPTDFSCTCEELVVVEIFAGTATLADAFRAQKFSVIAVDKTNERKPKVSLKCLDLTQDKDVDILIDILVSSNLGAVHLAPPCGTSSKAREKPLPSNMSHLRAEPLRSDHQLLGLDGLSKADAARVKAANRLYEVALLCIFIAVVRGAIVSAENPSSSYFWPILILLARHSKLLQDALNSLEQVHFQACMHGSTRDKWTCWLSTVGVFVGLRAVCDHSHSHESWQPKIVDGKPFFPTASEAAYPSELCRKVAMMVATECEKRGTKFPSEMFNPQGHLAEPSFSVKIGHKTLPPLIAEYLEITAEKPDPEVDFKTLSHVPHIPKKGVWDEFIKSSRGTKINVGDNYDKEVFGIFRSPCQFVEAALTAKHPIDMSFPLPDVLVKAIVTVINEGPKLTNARRKLQMAKLKRMTVQFKSQEIELHKKLRPELETVLANKNLLLWKQLMQMTGYDDPSLFDEVCSGFRLTGVASTSNEFPHGFQAAAQSEQQLKTSAPWLRKSTIAKCKASDDPDLDTVTWDQTMDETAKGWLKGPFTEEQICDMMGGSQQWIATRRFPLRQKDKVRMIDDCTASGMNAAFAATNKLVLLDVDALASMILCAMKAVQCDTKTRITLGNGEHVFLQASQDWGKSLNLLGRTLDLESAYKQVGAFVDDLWNRIIVVFDPHSARPAFFVATALMFGSSASVYAFNRISRSLWHIQTAMFNVWSTNFYDDYPTVEPGEVATSSLEASSLLLDCLGWKFAKEGKKALPFAEVFSVLGVQLHLGNSSKGEIWMQNKPDRVASISATVERLHDRGKIHAGEAASLHGQLNFSQGQMLGAALKPAMVYLSEIANQGWGHHHKALLGVFREFVTNTLKSSKPRRASVGDDTTPVLLFTDGAWEPSNDSPAGAGVVIIDPLQNTRNVHVVSIPDVLVEHWKSLGKKQLIAELELFPIVVALANYAEQIRGRRVLIFVDNNSVRDVMIKGSSRSASLFVMLAEFARRAHREQLLLWISRVPSKSNIADFPSRGQPDTAAKLIGAAVGKLLEAPEAFVRACLKIENFSDMLSSP